MNFYEHDIDAYQKKTAHLSLLEHGIYLLMLQVYYVTEKPLPADKSLYRVVRAGTRAERVAVDAMVKQFWDKSEGGLTNARADEVIAAHHAFIARQSIKGKASAAKRKASHGSTTVQPRLNGGTNHGSTGVPTGHPTGTQPIHKDRARQIPDSDSEDQGSSANGAHPPDPRKQLFELGKTILGANAGGLISKAISASDEATVGAILGEMALKPTADPRAYFTAAARRKGEGERFKTA